MLDLIWGAKTTALFDIWSIEHVIAGISVGAVVIKTNVKALNKLIEAEQKIHHHLHFDIVSVLFLAFAWEAVEHYLEAGIAGEQVAYWFQGVEFWGNRLITDPLMLVIGYMIAKKYPALVIPARVFSVAWLVTHIFAFPHSMYIQDVLLK